ncbi:MAG: hypothetical protein RMJ43_12200 [Chloroherpetonaceae bacterium]|nr:hypothetical protein [Chthonomonadaceae bacterium]MDW8208589.1 hypothetical protein [Chloroherpetonaceae bacterium]
MQRWRSGLLMLATVVVTLLFLSDFLTGRMHFEFENPYTRTRRIVEHKFGLQRETVIEHPGMSELYYRVLQMPRVDRWEPSGVSYRVERFTGRQILETASVPPVMFLPPDQELAFLQALPHHAARRAVITALFSPRKVLTEPGAAEYNEQLTRRERERVRLICAWYDFDRKDYALSQREWWQKHAAAFGVRPDGTPLTRSEERVAQHRP